MGQGMADRLGDRDRVENLTRSARADPAVRGHQRRAQVGNSSICLTKCSAMQEENLPQIVWVWQRITVRGARLPASFSVWYQQPEGPTGMRAGLVRRPGAESTKYQQANRLSTSRR